MKILLSAVILFLSTEIAAAQSHKLYPAAVAFRSRCCGVPNSRPLLDFVKIFKQKYHLKAISFDSVGPLGREGEYSLYFPLKEMSSARAKLFIAGLKMVTAKMTDRGFAEVEENTSEPAQTPRSAQVSRMKL